MRAPYIGMVRIYPRDLVSFQFEELHFCAAIPTPVKFFGDELSFAFYRTSKRPLSAAELPAGPQSGSAP